MCCLRPGGGWLEWAVGGWKAFLMGNGTMVCGDTLMFNHKWPPDAGSHRRAPLLITVALKRVHCTPSPLRTSVNPPPLPTTHTL